MVVRTRVEGGAVMLDYATTPAKLAVGADGVARGKGISLERAGDALVMRREDENRVVTPRPLVPSVRVDPDIAGRYWSDELEAWLEIGVGDGAAWAGFEGMLGRGPVERMYPVAEDVWIVTSRRSMDASPPGDWTVLVHREGGRVDGSDAGLLAGAGDLLSARGLTGQPGARGPSLRGSSGASLGPIAGAPARRQGGWVLVLWCKGDAPDLRVDAERARPGAGRRVPDTLWRIGEGRVSP